MNRRPFLAGLFACAALVALVALARTDQTVLYEKASAYSTIVVTEEENGVRALRFGKGGARQSVVKLGDPDYLALPYAQVARVGLALSEEPRRFLDARAKNQSGRVLRDPELEQRKRDGFSK